tara:strand:+ start:1202 stop:1597 length:396 start_codon:yes stop_codon:yes gene_type:complete
MKNLLGDVIDKFKNACMENFENENENENGNGNGNGNGSGNGNGNGNRNGNGNEIVYSNNNLSNKKSKNGKNKCWTNFVSAFLNWLVVTVITLFIGKFLWNNYLVPAIAIFNPVNSIIQMFAIVILIQLLTV